MKLTPFLFALALLTPTLAAAEAPRVIDMTSTLLDLKGQPIKDMTKATKEDPQCAKCGPLTLGVAVGLALTTPRQEEHLSALDSAKRGALALRIYGEKSVTLTADQISMIIKLMDIWGPLITARAVPMLDPAQDLTK